MKAIKAIFFDYDGVLADTMLDNFQAWYYAFKKYNAEIQTFDYMPLEGLSPKRIVEKIGGKYGINTVLFPEIITAKEDYYKKNNNFRLYDGIEDLIHELKQNNIKLALVSGASIARIQLVTPQEFLSQFDAVVGAESITHPKPHKEPYEKALYLLGIKPSEALVIENAPLGIASAKEAGVYCIAICSTVSKDLLGKADMIVDTIQDLRSIIKTVVTGGKMLQWILI